MMGVSDVCMGFVLKSDQHLGLYTLEACDLNIIEHQSHLRLYTLEAGDSTSLNISHISVLPIASSERVIEKVI